MKIRNAETFGEVKVTIKLTTGAAGESPPEAVLKHMAEELMKEISLAWQIDEIAIDYKHFKLEEGIRLYLRRPRKRKEQEVPLGEHPETDQKPR